MRVIAITILFFFSIFSWGQNEIQKAKKIIQHLSSPKLGGRGYVNDGTNKAAKFITSYYKEYNLIPFKANSYAQFFNISVNTFPDKIKVKINGKRLRPGIDFLVRPESNTGKGRYKLIAKDSLSFISSQKEIPIIINKVKKLTWSVSDKVENYIGVELLIDSFPAKIQDAEIHIKNKYIPNYQVQNICGYVKGKICPDSFIVFTAHYDHLGKMGKKTYFPGANDNASGISMIIELMDYYSKNPPNYSIGFICFAAEEVGLLGSKFYTQHPFFSLKQIKFLVNLDLLGTGDDGITVVNGSLYQEDFDRLKKINEEFQLMKTIKPRGKAANSDHYWFSEQGVPSFFIYTLGGIKAYHDVFDRASTLPLTKFTEVKQLLIKFASSKMR